MANADRPQGFRVHGKLLRSQAYESGAEVFTGDAVKLNASGQVVAAAAGDALLGVALNYASASGKELLVADHPDQLFVGQADETEIDAQTDIGNVCDILATAGSSTYEASRMEVDSSTISAAASAQVQILQLKKDVGNALGAQADVVFRINEHQLKDSSIGV